MIKTSELDQVSKLTSEDLLMISQLVNETDLKSFKVTLDMVKKFLGEITLVDVGVDLNTLTTPGIYILQGAATMQESYNLNYPSGLNPGSRVIMTVSAETANWEMVVQNYLYAKLASNPCPWSRGKHDGAPWGAWTQGLSKATFDGSAVQQVNMANDNAHLQQVTSGKTSVIWSFRAPNNSSSTPLSVTSPTKKPGVKFDLVKPDSAPIIGVYRGNVIIVDADGRLFKNVDHTQITDQENPPDIDWTEYLGVKMKDIEAIAHCDPNDAMSVGVAVNRLIDVLRTVRGISEGNPTAKTVSIDQGSWNPTSPVGDTQSINISVRPADFNGKLYVRLTGEGEGTITGREDKEGYSILERDMIHGINDAEGRYIESVAMFNFTCIGTTAGVAAIEISETEDFAVIKATTPITFT